MKGIKKADYIIQIVLIVAGLILGLTAKRVLDDEQFFIGYFAVGGWQVLSVIVHFFYKAPYNIRMRKIYLITLGIVLLILGLSIPTDGIIVALVGLLFFSPVMAIYYLVTCIRETQALEVLTTAPPTEVPQQL
jgi:hypothetical protein